MVLHSIVTRCQIQRGSLTTQVHAKARDYWARFPVAIVFCVWVLTRAVDRCFNTRVMSALGPVYGTVSNAFFYLPFLQILQLPIFAGYIAWQRWKVGDKRFDLRFFWWNSPAITEGEAPAPSPLWFLAYVAQVSLFTIFMAVPIPFLKPSFYYALSQVSTVSLTMLTSVLFMRMRFQVSHYLGATICVMALLVQLVPLSVDRGARPCEFVSATLANGTVVEEMRDPQNCFSSYSTPEGQWKLLSSGAMVMWIAVLVFAYVPSATSTCFVAHKLSVAKVDVWWFAWIQNYINIPVNMLMIMAAWLPWPETNPLKPADTFSAIGWTWDCLNGVDTAKALGRDFGQSCDAQNGMFWFMMYLLFNVWYNIFFFWLVRKCGPVWFQVGSMLCLGLTQVLTQFQWLMGERATALRFADWLSLFILVAGFWVYNLQKEHKKPKFTEEEKAEILRTEAP